MEHEHQHVLDVGLPDRGFKPCPVGATLWPFCVTFPCITGFKAQGRSDLCPTGFDQQRHVGQLPIILDQLGLMPSEHLLREAIILVHADQPPPGQRRLERESYALRNATNCNKAGLYALRFSIAQ